MEVELEAYTVRKMLQTKLQFIDLGEILGSIEYKSLHDHDDSKPLHFFAIFFLPMN